MSGPSLPTRHARTHPPPRRRRVTTSIPANPAPTKGPRMPRSRLLFLVLTACVTLGALAPAQAATYYLNPASGADSNTGLSATAPPPNGPWKTLFKVKSSVTAGDTVNVIGGTYTATQYKGESGTPLWTHAHGLGSAN